MACYLGRSIRFIYAPKMTAKPLSWAAVAGKSTNTITSPESSTSSTQESTVQDVVQTSAIFASSPVQSSANNGPAHTQRSNIAFISGHIDITPLQFQENYWPALDAAIEHGETFVLSNAGGADTLALAYLRSKSVDPGRITIYMHTPRLNRKLNATQERINKMRLGPAVEERYRKEGYNQKVIEGYHGARDAAMTEASDYDILWVRCDEDTKALYGGRYRPGRVSGTQKNKDRREEKNARLFSTASCQFPGKFKSRTESISGTNNN